MKTLETLETLETLDTLCSTLFRNPPSMKHLIARDKRRRALVQKHQAKRQELKRILKDRHLSPQGAHDGPTSVECPSSKQFCIARLQPLHHHGSFEGCIPKI